MYYIIRTIIGLVLLFGTLIFLKHKELCRKQISTFFIVGITTILLCSSFFWPFENLFITFSSPKDAYEYSTFKGSDIELVVAGNSADFIVNQKGDSTAYLIIPKTANGWKIGMGIDTKLILQKRSGDILVEVYQYANTEEYFITVFDTNGGESNISDSYNTEFHALEEKNDFLNKTFITYFAYIPHYDSLYTLEVNGDLIKLFYE